jgi:ATP-dependent helicase Lhr and Lhr-like helicase
VPDPTAAGSPGSPTPGEPAGEPANPLGLFSQAARTWFTGAFAAPTHAQAQAWEAISSGRHTLVIAPTGSGKTLAAFLWALDRLAAAPPPEDPAARCRVLYVSPLKALAVDIERNLRAPLTGLRHAAHRLGLPEPEIRVAVRSGDTAAEERRRLAASPPDILITTPESLFLLLTSRARETLRNVQTVIVDEVHALAGNKRGAHLALSLERLDALKIPNGCAGTATPDAGAASGAASAKQPQRGVPGSASHDGPGGSAGGRERPPRPAQRIGLSATVRPPEEVAAFLGGDQPVTVAAPPYEKRFDLKIVVPVEDMTEVPPPGGAVAGGSGPSAVGPLEARGGPTGGAAGVAPGQHRGGSPGGTASPRAGRDAGPDLTDAQPGGTGSRSIWPHVEERVLDLIEDHRSTIVFANSRRLSERLCAALNDLAYERASGEALPADHAPPAEIMAQAPTARGAPPEVVRAHHGSVSKAERAQIEEALKAGKLPAVVATSSLELGIDMGAVDLVVQVESPPSVASGLQRVGRAGHQVGEVSRGVIFPKYRGDLVQSAVTAERMRTGQIEEIQCPRNPLDVLAQQIVAMTAMDDWPVDALEKVVRAAQPFRTLSRQVLEAVLDMLAGRYPSDQFAELRPRVVWDRVTGTLRGRPGAQRLAVTSGGTIPDRGLFGVFLAGRESSRVGELDEEMVYESRVGDVFVLGASSWRIEDITADRVLVSPAPGQPGKLPFWNGDAPGRPAELGQAIGAFCRELSQLDHSAALARARKAGLDDHAAANLVSYLAEQRQVTGCVPDDRTIVIERFKDELGDWRVVVHSPYGARVHAPWALALASKLRERYGDMDIQAVHADDGIVLRIPDTDEPPPADMILFDPDEIEQAVTAELGGSALLASRFRECAARALLLPRRRPDRRTPLWQQRQRAAQLLAVASQYSTFPIVLETVRECLQDVFDMPALTGLMRDIAARKVRLAEAETVMPSPFARSLLFAYVGAFMYEGDAPLAERRAQALTLDSVLLAELLGRAELRELLDPEVIAETEREVQRLAEDRRARGVEGAADLLREMGPLSAAEVAERAAEPGAAAGWLSELEAARRAIQVRIAGTARWAAVEDAGRLRDALGVPLPVGVPEAFTEPVPDPLGDLVARYARTHGPFTAADVAARYGLGVAVVSGALERLAAEGRVSEGELRPGGRGSEWCDAGVLRMLRRRSLARLRAETEPSPPGALARLLPAWQHVAVAAAHVPGAAVGNSGVRRGHEAPRTVPGGQRGSLHALLDAVDQLQGAALPASALETLVLPSRVPGYSPAMLDELTAAGEVLWAGAGSVGGTRPGGDGWLVLVPAETAPLLLPEPAELTMTPLHEAVLAALGGGGALFFRMLADQVIRALPGWEPASPGSGRGGASAGEAPPRDRLAAGTSADGLGVTDQALASALWDLVWSGRVTNDTLAPLRTLLGAARTGHRASPPSGPADADQVRWPRPAAARPGRSAGRRRGFGRLSMPSRAGPPTVSGRWSLLPERDDDHTRRSYALAETLLDRYGVLTRGVVAAERVPGGFAAVYPVLRALEETGRCRRGYFVEGLGAAQFALPGAVDRMRALREPAQQGAASANASTHGRGEALVLSAADPANPYGAALPWPQRPGETAGSHRPGRKTGALVVLIEGGLVLYVERGGRTLLSWSDDPGTLGPAAAALARAVHDGALGRLTVERADGAYVYESPLAQALQDAGFHPTPRGLRLRA